MAENVKNTLTPEAAWKATLGELELQMTKATFRTWLADARLVKTDGRKYVIGVRNDYALDWIEDTIKRTLSAITGTSVELEFIVIEDDAPQNHNQPKLLDLQNGSSPPDSRRKSPPNRHQPPTDDNRAIRYRRIRPPTDPLKGHVQVSHYAIRFWREYLCRKYPGGAKVFDLWLIISSYAYEFEVLQKDGPSIKQLIQKLGMGDRNEMVGRDAWSNNKVKHAAKIGLLNILRKEHICHHYSEGKRRGQKQYFDFLTRIEHAPLLTPKQVALLSPDGQREHKEWLQIHTAVSHADWLEDDRKTAIPVIPVEEDR